MRIRLGRPVKYPGRQVILVRPVRCAAYVRKVGDDFAYVPQTATVGLAVSGRSYLLGARLATLTDGRHSIEVSTMPPQPERVVACGDIPRS